VLGCEATSHLLVERNDAGLHHWLLYTDIS